MRNGTARHGPDAGRWSAARSAFWPRALGGGALGGVAGKLTHGSLGLTDEAANQVKQHLTDGGAALVVLCDDFEVESTMEQIKAAGGEAQGFGVSAAVLSAIHDKQADNVRFNEIMDDYTNDLMV
jgi:uncharacterized membrane protein